MDEEPRAVYTHCYGQSLNLAASEAITNSKLMKDALDTTHARDHKTHQVFSKA